MGYFDRVTVSSHILYTANQETETAEGVSGVLLSFMCLWNVPGMGALITCMDPSVGHLNGILARVRGNLNNNFRKSQMPGDLPGGGGGVEASIWPIHYSIKYGKGGNKFRADFRVPETHYGLEWNRLISLTWCTILCICQIPLESENSFSATEIYGFEIALSLAVHRKRWWRKWCSEVNVRKIGAIKGDGKPTRLLPHAKM